MSFRHWWRGLRGKPKSHDFQRQQAKFRKRYPHYSLGAGTYGMPKVYDYLEGSTLHIGAYCSIAGGVQIFLGGHHRLDWVSSYPFPAFFPEASHIPEYVGSRGDVVIGNDVWLCADCTILSGVTIGHGAVIANSAVISRDVEPYAVMAGNPAQRVRWRFDETTRAALLASAWWDWPETEIRQVVGLICSSDIQVFLDYCKSRADRTNG